MSEVFYRSLTKETLFANPNSYGWNVFLLYHQLTRDEILKYKDHMEIKDIVRYQNAASLSFIKSNFQKEVDECWCLSWADVENYSKYRD